MFKNYLAAALRNLARNKLYAGISIIGLLIGISSAMLMALVIRNQLSFDRFIPDFERIYVAISILTPPGRAPDYDTLTHHRFAALLKDRTEIEAVTRLAPQQVTLRHDRLTAREHIYWADANVFDLLSLPVASGDAAGALQRPDSIVLTKEVARKYFGRDDAVGQSLVVDDHTMTVGAILEDLPVNGTQLQSGIFASGLASYSPLWKQDNAPASVSGFAITVHTFVRLASHASAEALVPWSSAQLRELGVPPIYGVQFLRVDRVNHFPGFNPGFQSKLIMAGILGTLILMVASLNFIMLFTAQTARRVLEVGIRKASGANRGALMRQFFGETFIYVALATVLAIALTELALPKTNAFLNSGAELDYGDPGLLACLMALTSLLTLATGAYPSLILSGLRPAAILSGVIRLIGGCGARMAWTTLQFAVLIGLTITAAVIYQQRIFATSDALRIDTDQVLIVRSACNTVLKNQLQALPGIRNVACAGEALLTGRGFSNLKLSDGSPITIDWLDVEPEIFSLYGLKAVAGALSPNSRGDLPAGAQHYVINELAAQRLGFVPATAAVGQSLPLKGDISETATIIGVVPDFSIYDIQQSIRPTIYSLGKDNRYQIINVKLTGPDLPSTLAAIDKSWRATGATQPVERFLLNDYLQNRYLSLLRQAQAFGMFSCFSIILSCLGLFALAAFIAERRTKEIGVRKALGAGTSEIMRMLAWQFVQPVLWASLIAWPVSAWIMNEWLHGFAYHVDLNPWIFIGATVLALFIALATVSMHCYHVARAKPVAALRYE
ncbi:MAG: ABC transporter permease [Steroidobacteraceae bacterium]